MDDYMTNEIFVDYCFWTFVANCIFFNILNFGLSILFCIHYAILVFHFELLLRIYYVFSKDLFSLLGGQQSEVDSLNILGSQIMQANDENIRKLVRKHLDGLNDNWQKVKEKVLLEQPFYLPLPVEQKTGAEYDDELEIEKVKKKPNLECIPDDHLRYQVLFSDVFDWLVICEENIRIQIPRKFELDKFERISARFMVGC